MKTFPVIAAGALLATWTGQAGPCSCGGDGPPAYYIETGAIIPANTRGIPCSFKVPTKPFTTPLIRFDEYEREVPFTFEAVPYPSGWAGRDNEPGHELTLLCADWVPGASYRLGRGPYATEFSVSPDSFTTDTSTFGIWESKRGPVTSMTLVGSCSTRFSAYRLGIEMSEQVTRWNEALLYYTVVDDKGWRPSKSLCDPTYLGRSWVGFGRELLYCACSGSGGAPYSNLSSGQHEVMMIAWLPGVYECRATTTVRLGCD